MCHSKLLIVAMLLLLTHGAIAQCTLRVTIAKDLYGDIYISDTTEVFAKGSITVYNSRTKHEIVKLEVEELTVTLPSHDRNKKLIPIKYAEQYQILYEDYNFDGKKDLAVMDGQFSCYHGPSYQVYLATENGFTQNEDFTALAQENCGMFGADAKTQTLETATKSGCCWHQTAAYKVINNKPVLISSSTIGLTPSGLTVEYSDDNLVNGKMETTSYQEINFEDPVHSEVLQFEFSNKKKLYLWFSEGYLYYIFTNDNNRVELFYADKFTFSTQNNSLSFTNLKTTYTITDAGVQVITPNKNINMKAVKESVHGSVSSLLTLKPDNVTFAE